MGENTTDAPQLEPANRVVPHVVFDTWKSPALAPDIAMLMAMFDELSFVTVTCCRLPEAPTGILDQVRVAGVTLTPETETHPVSSRQQNTSSRQIRRAAGLIGAVANGEFMQTLKMLDENSGSVAGRPVEPGSEAAGAMCGGFPDSCI